VQTEHVRLGYAAVRHKIHEQGDERPVSPGGPGLPPARSLASLIGKGASATAPGYRRSLAKRSFGSIGLEVGGEGTFQL